MGYLYDLAKKENASFGRIMGVINNITKQNKMLYTAVFQLTPFCNLKCKMCYARLDPKEVSDAGKRVMTFDEWKYYVDCVVEMGVYLVTFTGGECTLHPDFVKIYSYAYDKGLNISVMTNCTNITDELISLFTSKPPLSISMTFYGSSPETYEKLCGNRNAYYKTYENFEKLLDAGITVTAKYTFTKYNIADYEAVDEYCTEKGLDMMLSNELLILDNCDSKTIEEVNVDFDEKEKQILKVFFKKKGVSVEDAIKNSKENFFKSCEMRASNPKKNDYIGCSSGKNTLHITWEGFMTPCVSFLEFKEDPRKIGFEKCWKKMNEWMDNLPIIEECLECVFTGKCLSCVAAHYNDTGEFGKVSPRLCWKRKHPEEAAEIMKRLEDEGLINKDEQKQQ